MNKIKHYMNKHHIDAVWFLKVIIGFVLLIIGLPAMYEMAKVVCGILGLVLLVGAFTVRRF
jgi:uncharacterized membrane protein